MAIVILVYKLSQYLNFASFFRKLERIGQKVEQDLLEPLLIYRNLSRKAQSFKRNIDFLGLCLIAHDVHYLLDSWWQQRLFDGLSELARF